MREDSELLTWQEVSSKAPACPGLYAWYGRLNVGAADLSSPEELRRALNRHTDRHALAELDIQVAGPFEQRWRAKASNTRLSATQSGLTGPVLPEQTKELESVAALLRHATPTFAAPVYVGVSNNVRRRLQTHQRHILSRLGNEAVSDEPIEPRDAEFADRVTRAGFSPNHLAVAVITFEEITEAELDPEHSRQLVEIAEWYINRWYTPLFGRR